MSIKLLPQSIILKIAAGEVIERPASVVKELVENSLDANATQIQVTTSKDSIGILDNGKGMDKEDLELSYIRHATSKINSEDDLFNIHSLGFRGEALASISAVALVEITSKTADRENAYKIIVQGGEKVSISPAPFPYDSGTEIVVKNLFYNTPARKKYMTSDANENRLITEVISNYTLASSAHFTLLQGNKRVLTSPKGSLLDRFFSIYGKDAEHMKDLTEIQAESYDEAKQQFFDQGITISGLFSTPKLYRKSRSGQIIFVNGRLIKSSTIYAAIAQAYKGYLNTGEHPFAVLKITIDPKRIDVNVHPTKQEIKFDDDSLIFKSVYHILHEALLASDLTRTVSFEEMPQHKEMQKELVAEIEKEENLGQVKSSQKFPENRKSVSHFKDQLILADEAPTKQEEELHEIENKNHELLKVLSIFNKEFVLAENTTTKKLAIIDFHAAAEIVNYEKFTNQFKADAVVKQILLEPELIELSQADTLIVDEHQSLFEDLGYDVELFGETSIKVKTVPLLFGRTLDKILFIELIDQLKEKGQATALEELKDKIITRMSCRASEKAGDVLTLAQAEKIIADLFKLFGNSYNCPHGRPTIIELSHEDLEKMFKRIR